ncbi:hypothetical protein JCM1840_007406 [Sporobolomyces johnsonii]
MVKGTAAGYSTRAADSRAPPHPPSQDDDPERSVASVLATESAFDPLLTSNVSSAAYSHEPVFPLIQRVRFEVESVIDTPLSYDTLKAPSLNFSVVRPLSVKLSSGGESGRPPASLIYCLLVCRAHFLDRADDDLAFAGVNKARSDLCELLAIKLLSAYGSAPSSLELLHVLTIPFNPFSGATLDMFPSDENLDDTELADMLEHGKEDATNALELGISSKAKRFVKAPLVQQVIKAIYEGEIMYTPETTSGSLIQDTYKTKPVCEIYDWRVRPFLDHYRLRVPRIRNRLEFGSFAGMLILFLITQATHSLSAINLWEAFYIFWSVGFALDEFAALHENGISAYWAGAFNALDSIYCLIFFAFLGLRVTGLRTNDTDMCRLAFDTLGLAGCVLLPRMTISLLKGNVVLLALSKMVSEFVVFMSLAALTASGFGLTFYVLARGSWGAGRISWLLVRMWLGGTFLGFDTAQEFHPVYGPALVVVFAILSQTLLVTILISLLSNTFATVQANAETEILYQTALRTIERVKSDPLTSYVAPLNTVAFGILFPLRWVASPRVLHKAQVYLARTLNLPILLSLALHIRATQQKRSYLFKTAQRTQRAFSSLPRGLALGMVPWEGTVDSVTRVFELEVNERGRKVDGLDEREREEERPQTPERRKRGNPPAIRTRGQHDRMGSLASPLAKIFGQQIAVEQPLGGEGRGSSSNTAARGGISAWLPRASSLLYTTNEGGVKDKDKDKEHASSMAASSKSIDDRLEAIEEALKILLGEVVRSKTGGGDAGGGEGGGGGAGDGTSASPKHVPLTSLTGEIEETYADE